MKVRIIGRERVPTGSPCLFVMHEVPLDRLGYLADPAEFGYDASVATIMGWLNAGRSVYLPACMGATGSVSLGAINPRIAQVMRLAPGTSVVPVAQDHRAGVVAYGSPCATVEEVRRSLYELSVQTFAMRPQLEEHLGRACIRSLKKAWRKPIFIDGFQEGRSLSGGMLLSAAWEFALWLRANIADERVGVILPSGLGAAIANLGCVLAGKVPVNLNFTAGRAANEAALRIGGLNQVLTAAAMRGKVRDFPWPERTHDVREILTGIGKVRVLRRWLVASLTSAESIAEQLQLPATGGSREAALLFTSGSSGEPKGVVLTHRNILSNVEQISEVLSRCPIRSVLACLPIFHSFGCTVTFWWPILGGPHGVTYVTPNETTKLAELIEKHQVDLLLNTPTFLRNFLRKAKPEQLRSLKLVVTGAEKLPEELCRSFEERFQVPVCEGYGMTEATPVVAVNLVDFRASPGSAEYEAPRRTGSVGRLLPGMAVRVCHPETREELPWGASGGICLKGNNIFPGYLNQPEKTAQVLNDGWYWTGDWGRVDEDGFLHIEGRLSRFSKIGGEMVPHGVVEERLLQVFQALGVEGASLVVMGVPDFERGEALVVVTTRDIDLNEARGLLRELGLPNLWMPYLKVVVGEIPQLATGKLDLRACQQLALRAKGIES